MPIGLRVIDLGRIFTSPPPAGAALRGQGFGITPVRAKNEKPKYEIGAFDGLFITLGLMQFCRKGVS